MELLNLGPDPQSYFDPHSNPDSESNPDPFPDFYIRILFLTLTLFLTILLKFLANCERK